MTWRWVERGYAGLLVLIAVSAGPAAGAGSARSGMAITARVAAVARIERLEQPAFVTITSAHATSGYVTARAHLEVSSNSVDGYVLTLWPRASWFESMQVAGDGTTAEIPDSGGAIVRRRGSSTLDEFSVDFTFRLRDGVTHGDYAWPVEFTVAPL